MTREEAIKLLRKMRETIDRNNKYGEAEEMGIQALEQEPCTDAISRQAALKELTVSAEHHANNSREEVLLRRDRDIIRALPSVKPQEKTRHWINIDDIESECSECGHREPNERFIFEDINFCPNCGAKMD